MLPTVQIGPLALPSYWLAAMLGILCCLAVGLPRARRFQLAQVDVTNAAFIGLCGAMIGAKGLYLITIVPRLWRARAALAAQPALLAQVLHSGFVFYGGLIGFLLAVRWYLRQYQLDEALFGDFLAPLVPLFHAFGRVGCFLTGCCYGRESARFGIAFAVSESAPNGVPLLPVQLWEAAFLLLLSLAVALFERRRHGEGRALWLYLGCYAVWRFGLEFLRGDEIRGIWLGLSTSQWVSLALLAACGWRAYTLRRARKECKQ